MSARFVTLLPQPDSPTSPSVSPSSRSNETPLTAWTVPSWVRKRTTRSEIERRCICLPLEPWVERFPEAVAEEVEPDGADDDGRAGEEDQPRSRLNERARVGQHLAPLRHARVAGAEAEEAESRHVDDRGGRSERRL